MHAIGRLAGASLALGAFIAVADPGQAQTRGKTQAEVRACGGPAKSHAQCLKVCACLQGGDCKRYCDNIYKK